MESRLASHIIKGRLLGVLCHRWCVTARGSYTFIPDGMGLEGARDLWCRGGFSCRYCRRGGLRPARQCLEVQLLLGSPSRATIVKLSWGQRANKAPTIRPPPPSLPFPRFAGKGRGGVPSARHLLATEGGTMWSACERCPERGHQDFRAHRYLV